MKKWRVTVEFDRVNPKTMKLESSERFSELYATDEVSAKKNALEMFRKNEPTRRRIHKVTVKPV